MQLLISRVGLELRRVDICSGGSANRCRYQDTKVESHKNSKIHPTGNAAALMSHAWRWRARRKE